jgi:hypothetical protein
MCICCDSAQLLYIHFRGAVAIVRKHSAVCDESLMMTVSACMLPHCSAVAAAAL